MDELMEFYKRIEKFKDEYGDIRESKYRKKLFNITAMNELVQNNTFLKSQYDKLKKSGKNIFGYHYNEIILSFIFIKYIKNKGDIYDRYLKLRSKAIKDSEMKDKNYKEYEIQDDEKSDKQGLKFKEELDEMDTFSAGDYQYSQPAAFAKGKKSWRHFQKPLNNAKIINLKDSKYRLDEGALKDYSKNDISKALTIYQINGEDPEKWLKNLTKNYANSKDFTVTFVFDIEEDIEGFEENAFTITIPYEDLIEIVKSYDNEGDLEKKGDDYLIGYIVNILEYEIFDDLNQYALKKLYKGNINEHHIDSTENQISFILNHSDLFTEDELNQMSPEEVNLIYMEIENKKMMNEEKQHDALTKLNRIHKETEKISNKYYKEYINKGMKTPDEGGHFEYDYNKDSIPNDEMKKFDNSANDEYTEVNRGETPADVDFAVDNKPSKEFLDRIKSEMGEEKFNLMLKKAKLRKLEKENQRNGKVMIQDPKKQAKELGIDLSKINESVKLIGRYSRGFEGGKLLYFNAKEAIKLNESKEDLTKLVLEGLGNSKNRYQKDSVKYLDFYLDEATGSVYYKPKEKNVIQISESYKKAMDSNMNHKTQTLNEYSKKRTNVRKMINEEKSWFELYQLPTNVKVKVENLNESVYEYYCNKDLDSSELIKEDLNKISSKLYGKERISYDEFEKIVKDKYKEVFK